MTAFLPKIRGINHVRWMLPASLVLNLFFVGAAGAVAFRYSNTVPLANIAHIEHSASDRLNRLAASLPATDAQVMRAELRADAQKVASVQADLRLSQDAFRDSLRAQPFDLEAMRAAMVRAQAARENFDLVLHDLIAAAAVRMSVVGRNKLADWPPAGRPVTTRD